MYIYFFVLFFAHDNKILKTCIIIVHSSSSVILNVQHLFQCKDDWYPWDGSGDSGLAPGLPWSVTWNEDTSPSVVTH